MAAHTGPAEVMEHGGAEAKAEEQNPRRRYCVQH
jgi:hypothetical protein